MNLKYEIIYTMSFVIILLIYANCVILNTVWGHLTNIKRLGGSIECKKAFPLRIWLWISSTKDKTGSFFVRTCMNIYAPLGTKKQSGPIRDLNPFKLSNCAIMEYFLHDGICISWHFSTVICP